MTTHTTARSAAHQYWLFDQHFTHQWEGFPGSHVLVWDPATRQCSDLGIPVARESIYGACYDERNHALGVVGVHCPVHKITLAGGHAYGVSGDPKDLGNLFHYSNKTGLREAGRMMIIPVEEPVFSNTQPLCVAISPNGERVAVSVADELGCVYVFKSVNIIPS